MSIRHTITRAQARSIDQLAIEQFGMTGLVLMENAARGCVDFLTSKNVHGPVLIVCGKGNNGGDGLAMARMLDNLEIAVHVALCADAGSLQGDAKANYEITSHCGIPIQPIDGAGGIESIVATLKPEWIVDALLGTGASGAPRGLFKTAIQEMNDAPGLKLALDVPSGLDCDTGAALGAVFKADFTCTFVAAKPGLLNPETPCVGQLNTVGIGAPRRLVQSVVGHQN